MDEGYIKFNSNRITTDPPEDIYLRKLNKWRTKLHELGLVGAYDNGIGFGNVSRRFKQSSFIISGSATGEIQELDDKHYVLVTNFNIAKNNLESRGMIDPSSESMTHGIIYRTLPDISSVFHIHNYNLWKKYKNILPTTAEHIAYGTPEMALEVKRLILTLSAHTSQVVIMGGHPEGVIIYGSSPEDTGNRLLKLIHTTS